MGNNWFTTIFGLIKFISLIAVLISGIYFLFTVNPILGVVSGILVGSTFKYEKG